MCRTLLSVLGLFLLSSPLYGDTEDITPRVILKSNWDQIFWGETATLGCEIEGNTETEWSYIWRTPRGHKETTHNEYNVSSATSSDDGEYKCIGRRIHQQQSYTKWSDPFRLTSVGYKPRPQLESEAVPAGGSVTLTCKVEPPSSGWSFLWYRGEKTSEIQTTPDEQTTVTRGGLYWCRGVRGNPPSYTQFSNSVVTNRAVVSLQTWWTETYRGETITLSCQILDGDEGEWVYEWETTSSDTLQQYTENFNNRVTVNNDGDYKCRGKLKTDPYSSTEWSAPVTVTASDRPKAELSADVRDIPLGGDVTLTCSVRSSSGWRYQYLYRPDKSLNSVIQNAGLSGQLRVSEEGLYQCRGQRGDPPYDTDDSEEIMINKKNADEAVSTLHPNWSEVYRGETITLRCEIKDGANTEWEYEWETTNSYKPPKQKEFSITTTHESHSGNYSCRGRRKSDRSSTEWSRPISLRVLSSSQTSVLTVSPSWLSPGDSVTLSCDVKHPSAGWRFFWYKAIPELPSYSLYNYELLSESNNGTENHSYIVHGQTHTSGYACRAGRGDPVKFTEHSEPKFVWSGGLSSAASLTVSPDRVQHFLSDSVSLICAGNSSQWRVKMFDKDGRLRDCSVWDEMTGSTCTINPYSQRNHVYWCESGSGEFSNAVNITKQNDDVILETPVYSVTEGNFISLPCKLRHKDMDTDSVVYFYLNDKLIQSNTSRELNISAVSKKKDQGFYKCQISGKESSQSWMSVKVSTVSRSEEFPLILIVGIIFGVVLLILLLLLFFYRQSKGSCPCGPLRSQRTNQDSVINPQEETHEGYYSRIKGEGSAYETIRVPENSANGAGQSQDVTYSLIELKNLRKKGEKAESQESTVYSEVKIPPADDTLMYAQVNHSKGKGKKKKKKSNDAPAEESVYSEVKPDQ